MSTLEHDDQRAVLEGIEQALATWRAASPPRLDDGYELAVAVGQARRLARVAADPALEALVAAGESALAEVETRKRYLDALDGAALLQSLEVALDAAAHPADVLDLLLEVDAHACAAAAVGHPQVAAELVADAALLVAAQGEAAAACAPMARAYIERHGIADDAPEHALWTAVVDAEAQLGDLAAVAAPDWLHGLLNDGGEGLGIVLPFRCREAQPSLAVDVGAGGDHSDEEPYLESEPQVLVQAEDEGWTLVVERPGAHLELALYGPQAPPLEVSADGRPLAVYREGDRQAVFLEPDHGELTVRVGDAQWTIRFRS